MVPVGVGVTSGVGVGVTSGVGVGVGVGLGLGLGDGLGLGVAVGGFAVGFGVGFRVGEGVGVGLSHGGGVAYVMIGRGLTGVPATWVGSGVGPRRSSVPPGMNPKSGGLGVPSLAGPDPGP